MITKDNTEVGISSEQQISSAIRDFTNALVDSKPYKKYRWRVKSSRTTRRAKALQEYRAKAKEQQTRQMFNTLTEARAARLSRTYGSFSGDKDCSGFFRRPG